MIPEHRALIDFLSHDRPQSYEDYEVFYNHLLHSDSFLNLFHSQFPGQKHIQSEELARMILIETPFYTNKDSRITRNFFGGYTILSFSPQFRGPRYSDYLVPFRDLSLPYDAERIKSSLIEMKHRFDLATVGYETYVFTLDGHFYHAESNTLAHYDGIQDLLQCTPSLRSYLGCTPILKDHPFLSGYMPSPLQYLPPSHGL